MEYLTPLQDEMNDRLINATDYGKCKNTVYDIFRDMSSRTGLEEELEQIDLDIQEQIIQKWIDIYNQNN